MIGKYAWDDSTGINDDTCFEVKGGKPSSGTPKDGRLKENKPGSGKPAADDGTPVVKPAFPGAAKPFTSGGKGKGK